MSPSGAADLWLRLASRTGAVKLRAVLAQARFGSSSPGSSTSIAMERGLLSRLVVSLCPRCAAGPDGLYISRPALTAWLADLGLRKPGRFVNDCFADSRISELRSSSDPNLYSLEAAGILAEFCGYAAGAADWEQVRQETQRAFQTQQRQDHVQQQCHGQIVAAAAPGGQIVAAAAPGGGRQAQQVVIWDRDALELMSKDELVEVAVAQSKRIQALQTKLANTRGVRDSWRRSNNKQKQKVQRATTQLVLQNEKQNVQLEHMFTGPGKRCLTLQGGMSLALRRTLCGVGANRLGLAIMEDVGRHAITSAEIRVRASLIAYTQNFNCHRSSRLAVKDDFIPDPILDIPAGVDARLAAMPCWRFSAYTIRGDATNSQVWQRRKLRWARRAPKL